MNKQTKENIQVIISLILIASGIFIVGRVVGHYQGYTERMEDEKRSTCKAENSYKPFNEVDAHCVKYFTEETK